MSRIHSEKYVAKVERSPHRPFKAKGTNENRPPVGVRANQHPCVLLSEHLQHRLGQGERLARPKRPHHNHRGNVWGGTRCHHAGHRPPLLRVEPWVPVQNVAPREPTRSSDRAVKQPPLRARSLRPLSPLNFCIACSFTPLSLYIVCSHLQNLKEKHLLLRFRKECFG